MILMLICIKLLAEISNKSFLLSLFGVKILGMLISNESKKQVSIEILIQLIPIQ